MDENDPTFTKISFEETGLGIFGYFLDQYGRVMEYDNNFKKHFKVTFTKYTRDLNRNPIYVKFETVTATRCTEKHF
jgi:hypothetical protein